MAGRAEGIGSEELHRMFGTMYDELVAWRKEHPHASADEIFAQMTPRRRKLMGKLLVVLALQAGGEALPVVLCERCGESMVYKGEASRDIEHIEGETELLRAYFHCPHCAGGVFPPGSGTEVGQA
jgi:hypothetical protein